MSQRANRRVAIISGSTSGIGRDIATRLHRDGLGVVITGRNHARGRQLREELGHHAVFVALDLTAREAPATLAQTALDAFGRLDVVVNNAAHDHTDDLLQIPLAQARSLFEINTIAPLALLQEGAKRMLRGGVIINVTSRLASVGVPSMGLYSASKGALQSLTTAAAVELAGRNIRVNAVAPGMTRTPLYDSWLEQQEDPAQAEQDVMDGIPLGRLATPGDVAAVVSFLASEEASYLTGVTIPVDGGYTAR